MRTKKPGNSTLPSPQPSTSTEGGTVQVGSLLSLLPNVLPNHENIIRNLLLDPFVGYSGDTSVRGVYAVEPSEYILVDQRAQLISTKYYDLRDSIGNSTHDTGLVSDTFAEVFSQHVRTDVEIGCGFSGGLDSSLLAWSLAERLDAQTFFTLDLGTATEIDLRHASESFHSLPGSGHDLRRVSPGSTSDSTRELVRATSSPVFDNRAGVWDAIYHDAAKSGVKVYLNGQGADEAWYGYYAQDWFWFSRLYKQSLSTQTVRDYLRERLARGTFGEHLSAHGWDVLDGLAADISDRLLTDSKDFGPERAVTIFLLENVLPSLLVQEDIHSMRYGVEVRVPFVDRRLIELALSMSPSAHLDEVGVGKYLLRTGPGSKMPSSMWLSKKRALPKPVRASEDRDLAVRNALDAVRHFDYMRDLFSPAKPHSSLNSTTGFYGSWSESVLQLDSIVEFHESVCES